MDILYLHAVGFGSVFFNLSVTYIGSIYIFVRLEHINKCTCALTAIYDIHIENRFNRKHVIVTTAAAAVV